MAAVLVVDSGHLVFGVFFSVCLFDGVFFYQFGFCLEAVCRPQPKKQLGTVLQLRCFEFLDWELG